MEFSRCFKKISAKRPDVGAPMASPSVWIRISPLLEKQFCAVMMSYHSSSSCRVWWLGTSLSNVLEIMSLVSFTGTFVYRFVMSSEARP